MKKKCIWPKLLHFDVNSKWTEVGSFGKWENSLKCFFFIFFFHTFIQFSVLSSKLWVQVTVQQWRSALSLIFSDLRFFPPPRFPSIDSRGVERSWKNIFVPFCRRNFDLPSILCRFCVDHGLSPVCHKITIFSPIRPSCHLQIHPQLPTCVH